MVFGGLFTTIERWRSRETLPEHKNLCDAILDVMCKWADRWGKDPDMKSLFNGNAIYHEMDEYVVPLYHLIAVLKDLDERRRDADTESPPIKVALFDVASGKGYLSLLISSLQSTSTYAGVLKGIQSIMMVDKNKVQSS
jgi:hypothetical protein